MNLCTTPEYITEDLAEFTKSLMSPLSWKTGTRKFYRWRTRVNYKTFCDNINEMMKKIKIKNHFTANIYHSVVKKQLTSIFLYSYYDYEAVIQSNIHLPRLRYNKFIVRDEPIFVYKNNKNQYVMSHKVVCCPKHNLDLNFRSCALCGHYKYCHQICSRCEHTSFCSDDEVKYLNYQKILIMDNVNIIISNNFIACPYNIDCSKQIQKLERNYLYARRINIYAYIKLN